MPRLTKFRCDRNLKEWSRFRHAKYIHGGGNLVKKGNKKLRRPMIALEDLNHSGFNLFDPISTTINQAAPLKVSEVKLNSFLLYKQIVFSHEISHEIIPTMRKARNLMRPTRDLSLSFVEQRALISCLAFYPAL